MSRACMHALVCVCVRKTMIIMGHRYRQWRYHVPHTVNIFHLTILCWKFPNGTIGDAMSHYGTVHNLYAYTTRAAM